MVLFRRQVEYFCTWFHFTFLCVGLTFATLLLVFLFYHGPISRIFGAAYLTFMWCNWSKGEEGGYTAFRMPSFYFRMIRDYFPIVLHDELDLTPEKSYLMVLHPHGILPIGYVAIITYLAEQRSSLTWHGCHTPLTFRVPFIRDYALYTAGISATEKGIMSVLNRPGRIVGLYVGGAKESYYNNEHVLVLKNRKGFCRLALKSGASIVPAYTFGENDVFTSVKFPESGWVRRFQGWFLEKTGLAFPIVKGPMKFQYQLVMPRRRPLNLVVAEPIHVKRVENPTKEEIDKLHETYLASLKKLFDDNKVKFGVGVDAELAFV